MMIRLPSAALIAAFAATMAAAQDIRPPAQTAAGLPAGVTAHRDLAYVPGGHERQKLDLYLPAEGAKPFPLIVWIHGGGWQNGSKNGCPTLRQGYLARGYALASLDYRLSGDAIFPAQIEDCKAALRWLREHAADYGIDPKRIGVWGSSAGGHLVALLGTSGDVAGFDTGTSSGQTSRVQAVCDYYGPTDLAAFVATPGYANHASDSSPEAKLIGGAIAANPDKAARANPIAYVTPDDPPFLIVHGDKDPTVPINQSQLLFAALTKAGVPAHFHTIHGAGHGNGFGGREIEEMVASFFDRCLKGTGTPCAGSQESASEASAMPAAGAGGAPGAQGRPKLRWEQVRAREDANGDGRVERGEFKGPPALFNVLDRNRDGSLTKDDFDEKPQG